MKTKSSLLDTLPIFETMPDCWHVLTGATTAPNGYVLIANGEISFSPDKKRKTGLLIETL